MTRTNRTIKLVLFLAVTTSVHSQSPATIHQSAPKSSCANIVALAGAEVNCSNLTPTQKKALENIPAILKMALNNQDYLDAIMAKLDEISKAQSPVQQTVNAPNGIGTIGGTLINPKVNNFRNPIPEIDVTESSSITPQPKPQSSDDHQRFPKPGTLYHPEAQVIVTTKGVFYNPAFVADCSVPCKFVTLFEEKKWRRNQLQS
jgi:hypothetical protein